MTAAPIKLSVWIDGALYRPLLARAQDKGYVDVSELLSRDAPDLLLAPPPPERKPYTFVTDEHRKRMRELAAEGRSLREIAAELGISHRSVLNHLERAEAER